MIFVKSMPTIYVLFCCMQIILFFLLIFLESNKIKVSKDFVIIVQNYRGISLSTLLVSGSIMPNLKIVRGEHQLLMSGVEI